PPSSRGKSAPSLSMPIASTFSNAPRRLRIGMFIGSSDSPMWKRGWRSFSSCVTRHPLRASSVAMVLPAGPPPITSTSVPETSGAAGAAALPAASGWTRFVVILNTGRCLAGLAEHDSGCTRGRLRADARCWIVAAPRGGNPRPRPVQPNGSPMSPQTDAERELAQLLVESLNLEEVEPGSIDPEAPLFNTGLGLDSIDALELALAISKRHGFQLRS